MPKVYLARQSIVNRNGKIHGYELLFRGDDGKPQHITSNLLATSKVLLNSLTHMDFSEITGKDKYAFVNVDHDILMSGILDLLNPDHFVIELLEDSELTPKVIERIQKLQAKGFRFALDDFDCSQESIKKVTPVLKYMNYVKIDMLQADLTRATKIIHVLHKSSIQVLAEKVEYQKEYRDYITAGFDLFQGYHIHKPETVEYEVAGETASKTILTVIAMLKSDKEVSEIETHVTANPDLAYNLLKYLNSAMHDKENKISSISHALNMLGRKNLMRWLIIYLYSESGGADYSPSLLAAALDRARQMEEKVEGKAEKEKAYIVGMFSMLDVLFQCDYELVFKGIPLEEELMSAIIHKSGDLGQHLHEVQQDSLLFLKNIVMDNFHKFKTSDLLRMIDNANIDMKIDINLDMPDINSN